MALRVRNDGCEEAELGHTQVRLVGTYARVFIPFGRDGKKVASRYDICRCHRTFFPLEKDDICVEGVK